VFMMCCAEIVPAAEKKEDTSVGGVCRDHPELVKKLFARLDLDRKGLEKVKQAVGGEDWPAACRELLAYYRNGTAPDWLRLGTVKPGTARDAGADPLLKDTFTIQAVTATQPRLKNGRLDWAHLGPRRDREWGWLLNRHSHFQQLLRAWGKTGNPEYARCFDAHVRDWVISNPCPAKQTAGSQWRVLEVGLRIRGSWPAAFYGFQQSDEFTPAGRILMLSSVPEHAEYCKRFHASRGNHVLMEMYGLANASACWPEFRNANAWYDYATKKMVPEIKRQVYPDGVQKELTSHYHWVSLANFEPFADLSKKLGRPIPEEYAKGVEGMWNYLAWSMRPDGFGALNNDSDRDGNRNRVAKAAERYGRDDWTYIATNGAKGKKPEGLPSKAFPWAGQLVMRSGFDADAHWAFFDVGPAGIGHQHNDRLHLSVAAYGRDLLVDAGRYWYKSDQWRKYFIGSKGHNVILIDGKVQRRGFNEVRQPAKGAFVFDPKFDYARGTFADGYEGLKGKATHQRAVGYVRGVCWVVADKITTDAPRNIQALWHFHPDCTVEADGLHAASVDRDKGNLRVIPVAGPEWKLEMVKGQTKPDLQGWYSPRYNVKEPNVAAVYSATIDKTQTFGWVLLPAKGAVPKPKIETIEAPPDGIGLRLTVPGQEPREIVLGFTTKLIRLK